jgi:hypothetical protein
MAAMKIQRMYRGMRYRKDLRKQTESKTIEASLDLEKEAEQLLRSFYKGSVEAFEFTTYCRLLGSIFRRVFVNHWCLFRRLG